MYHIKNIQNDKMILITKFPANDESGRLQLTTERTIRIHSCLYISCLKMASKFKFPDVSFKPCFFSFAINNSVLIKAKINL